MRKWGGEISSPLAYEEVDAIATIVELVREVVEPVIEAPFELVDIEYGKIGSDMILSIFEINLKELPWTTRQTWQKLSVLS